MSASSPHRNPWRRAFNDNLVCTYLGCGKPGTHMVRAPYDDAMPWCAKHHKGVLDVAGLGYAQGTSGEARTVAEIRKAAAEAPKVKSGRRRG